MTIPFCNRVVLDMGRMYIHNWLYLNYHVPAFHPDQRVIPIFYLELSS